MLSCTVSNRKDCSCISLLWLKYTYIMSPTSSHSCGIYTQLREIPSQYHSKLITHVHFRKKNRIWDVLTDYWSTNSNILILHSSQWFRREWKYKTNSPNWLWNGFTFPLWWNGQFHWIHAGSIQSSCIRSICSYFYNHTNWSRYGD